MADDLFVFNGVDGTTGSYLRAPLPPKIISRFAQGERPEPALLDELLWRHEQSTQATFGPGEGLDPRDLSQVGWGVVFAHGTDPGVREALMALLDHRRLQATAVHDSLYREFWGVDAYRPGETKSGFLARHGAGPGPVDPERMPYYLLLVGDGRDIPFSVQYQLDVQYAVGRISFESLEEYQRYAASVVAAETAGVPRSPSVSFFAPRNEGDRATELSSGELVGPLAQRLARDHPDWEVRAEVAGDATKKRLLSMLGGEATPSLLFTAGHGVAWPAGHPAQLAHQGALVCQEWPGPTSEELSEDAYLSAAQWELGQRTFVCLLWPERAVETTGSARESVGPLTDRRAHLRYLGLPVVTRTYSPAAPQ